MQTNGLRFTSTVQELKESINPKDMLRQHQEHLTRRKEQLKQAKYNRAKREAKFFGANMISGDHSVLDDLENTNPNYSTGEYGYTCNCQRCVVAYEARRRGIDVSAAEIPENDTLIDHWKKLCGKNQKWQFEYNIKNANDRKKKAEDIVKSFGDGSRAEIYVNFGDGTAHVFVAENRKGNIVFLDPQTNNSDVSFYFSQQKDNMFGVSRIDNLKFWDYSKQSIKMNK